MNPQFCYRQSVSLHHEAKASEKKETNPISHPPSLHPERPGQCCVAKYSPSRAHAGFAWVYRRRCVCERQTGSGLRYGRRGGFCGRLNISFQQLGSGGRLKDMLEVLDERTFEGYTGGAEDLAVGGNRGH